jgi:hypothetical protein
MKKYSLLILGALGIFLFTGCREEGCTDIEAINFNMDAKKDDGSCSYNGDIILHVHSNADGAQIDFGKVYSSESGANIKFTDVQFYMTEVEISDGDKNSAAPNSNHLIIHETDMYNLGQFAPGTISRIAFNVGVDSLQNHMDPSGADLPTALSANNNNFHHWSWNMGYRFIVIEGLVDTSANNSGTPNVQFQYHIGGDQLLNRFDQEAKVTLESSGSATIHLAVDYLKMLEGVDVKNNRIVHMPNATAGTISDNALKAISVQ